LLFLLKKEKTLNCKECPWKIKNQHNKKITDFSERMSKAHNCHMTEGVKKFWTPDEKYICKHFRTNEKESYDLAIFYTDWKTDDAPPGLALCKERAGIEGKVTHNAIEDAWR